MAKRKHPKKTTNRHHIPPKHPDKTIYIINEVDKEKHKAYHLLFGNSPTLEVCVEILKRDWWSQE